MRRARWLAIAAALGCVPTEIVLVVQSDLKAPQEIEEVEIRVSGSADAPPVLVDLTQPGVAFPLTLGLRPKGDGGPVLVDVVGKLVDKPVVKQRARTIFARQSCVNMSQLVGL